MELDKIEELQRSIDAVLARIEAQKRALGSLFRDCGPVAPLGSLRRPIMPWSASSAHAHRDRSK
jgi:hypothetical protein